MACAEGMAGEWGSYCCVVVALSRFFFFDADGVVFEIPISSKDIRLFLVDTRWHRR